MREIENTYWQLVRAALWTQNQASEGQNFPNSQALIQLCAQQGTGPLIFPMLLEAEKDPSLKTFMRMICVQNMHNQAQLERIGLRAWQALINAGIQPVLMKGFGLAHYYDEPTRRQWGDVDLFVGKTNYHPACAAMRAEFPGALKFDEELDHYKHYNLIAEGVSIEIHRVSMGLQHPIDARRYERIEHRGMTNTQMLIVNGVGLQIPEPTFNALFVMFHAWEHMLTKGANVRQLCDLALLLHNEQSTLDTNQLSKDLRALHLMDVWQLFMYLLVHYVGLPKNEAPFYTAHCAVRAERLMAHVLHPDTNQQQPNIRPSTNRFIRKIHTMRERLKLANRVGEWSPAYARHMRATTLLHGALRLFAKDRRWE